MKKDPHTAVNDAGKHKWNCSRAQHIADIFKNIRSRQLRRQKGTGGHRRTAIPEISAGKHCASHQERGYAQRSPHSAADHAHGCRRSKSSSCEKRDQAIQQKRHQEKNRRMNEFCRKADNDRYRPGLPPQRRQHADQQKGNQNIFDCFHSIDRVIKHLPERKSFFQSVNPENNQPGRQCDHDGLIKKQA